MRSPQTRPSEQPTGFGVAVFLFGGIASIAVGVAVVATADSFRCEIRGACRMSQTVREGGLSAAGSNTPLQPMHDTHDTKDKIREPQAQQQPAQNPGIDNAARDAVGRQVAHRTRTCRDNVWCDREAEAVALLALDEHAVDATAAWLATLPAGPPAMPYATARPDAVLDRMAALDWLEWVAKNDPSDNAGATAKAALTAIASAVRPPYLTPCQERLVAGDQLDALAALVRVDRDTGMDYVALRLRRNEPWRPILESAARGLIDTGVSRADMDVTLAALLAARGVADPRPPAVAATIRRALAADTR